MTTTGQPSRARVARRPRGAARTGSCPRRASPALPQPPPLSPTLAADGRSLSVAHPEGPIARRPVEKPRAA